MYGAEGLYGGFDIAQTYVWPPVHQLPTRAQKSGTQTIDDYVLLMNETLRVDQLQNRVQLLKDRHQTIKEENAVLRGHVQEMTERLQEIKAQNYALKYPSRTGSRQIAEAVKKDSGELAKKLNHVKEKLVMLEEDKEATIIQADDYILKIQQLLSEIDESENESMFYLMLILFTPVVNFLSETLTDPHDPLNPLMTVAMSLLGTTLINENSPGLKSLQNSLMKIDMFK